MSPQFPLHVNQDRSRQNCPVTPEAKLEHLEHWHASGTPQPSQTLVKTPHAVQPCHGCKNLSGVQWKTPQCLPSLLMSCQVPPYLDVFRRQKLQLSKHGIDVPGVFYGLQAKIRRMAVWLHIGIRVLAHKGLLQARHVFRANL